MNSLSSTSSRPKHDSAEALIQLRQTVDQQRVQLETERNASILASVGQHQEKERELQQQLVQARAALESMDIKSLSEAQSLHSFEAKELERLKAELEQRERRLKEQVSTLSEKLSRGETGPKDALTRRNADKGTVRKHLAQQKEALALEHGQRLAQLRGARESLVSERTMIESQLAQSSASSAAAVSPGSGGVDMNAFVRQLQGEQGAHKARLDRLRRELNDMQASSADEIIGSIKYKPANREYDVDEFALREARRRSHDEQEQAKLVARAEGGTVAAQQQQQQQQQHEHELLHQQHHPQTQLQQNTILPIEPIPPTSLLLPPVPPSGNPLVDEIMKISRDYVQSGGDNPAIMRAIQGLYSDALLPQPAQSAPPLMSFAAPVAAPQPPSLMANPIQDHLQTLIQQNQALLAASEADSKLLFSQAEQLLKSQRQNTSPVAAALETLTQKLQVPAAKSGEGASGAGGKIKGDSLFGSILKEEEELEMIKSLPADSALRVTRQKHLEDMIALKYEMQRIKQQAQVDRMTQELEKIKKEDERSKWVQEQEQQLLEAKFRKQLAKENPITSTSSDPRSSAVFKPNGIKYDADDGFTIFFDFIAKVENRINQCMLVYAFQEGSLPKSQPKVLPMASIDKVDSLFGQAIFAIKRSFTKVPINPSFTIVIEFQTLDVSTATPTPKAYLWTTLALFTPEGLLNAGLWKMPMFFPPTRPDISPAQIAKLNCKPDAYLFLRLVKAVDTSLHSAPVTPIAALSINPDEITLHFKIPPGYPKPKLSELEVEASLSMPPPATAGGNQEGRPKGDAESQAKPAVAEGGDAVGGLDRNALKSSGRLRTGMLARSDVEGFSVCINQITTIPSILVAKLLRITVFVRDRVTGDTLPVTVTSSQPAPLELQPGTAAFDQGQLTVTLANVPVDESVCCVVEISDASTLDLLSWCCLPIYEKNTLQLGTSKGSRPPTSQSVKEITKAAALSRRPLLLLKSATSKLCPPPVIITKLTQSEDPPPTANGLAGGVMHVTYVDTPPMHRDGSRAEQNEAGPIAPHAAQKEEEEGFIEIAAGALASALFVAGDGIDVYVDCLRFAPDSCGLSCVSASIVSGTIAKRVVHFTSTKTVQLTSPDARSPLFGLRMEARCGDGDGGAEGFVVPSSAVLLVHFTCVETKGRHAGSIRTIGSSIFPLFIDPSTGAAPLPSVSEFVLNEGPFQLPVHHVFLPPPPAPSSSKTKASAVSADATINSNLFDSAMVVPACSCLLRVVKAPVGSDGSIMSVKQLGLDPQQHEALGLVQPFKGYRQGKYTSVSCVPTEVDSTLFKQRLLRPVVSVKSAYELSKKSGFPLSQTDAETAIMQVFPSTATPTALFDLQYHSPAIGSKGFQLQLNSADNLPKNVECVFGILRAETPASKIDAKIWKAFDGTSQYRSPMWKDGPSTFAPVKPSTAFAIIELVSVVTQKSGFFGKSMLKEPEIVQCGWSVLPVMDDEGYIASGKYRLPLFAGSPPADLVASIGTSDVSVFLNESLRSFKAARMQWSSVIVSIANAAFDTENGIGETDKLLDMQTFMRSISYYTPRESSDYDTYVSSDPVSKQLPKGVDTLQHAENTLVVLKAKMKLGDMKTAS